MRRRRPGDELRELGRASGPSTGAMTASAIFGQAASMIAAPGSSILPSSVAVEPAGAALRHALEQVEHLLVARAGGRRRLSTPSRSRVEHRAPRRSCVAALFIAATTRGERQLLPRRERASTAVWARCTEP